MHPWTPFWLSAFVDLAPPDAERAVEFWRGVTGYALSAPRGTTGEFATLVPPDGDDFLRVQRLADGPSRIHLDVHVPDPAAAAVRAAGLGAKRLGPDGDLGYAVLRSPGDFVFCLVAHRCAQRPRPATWPGGHRSAVYQACLDVPGDRWETESAFWAGLLEAELEVLRARPEFTWARPGSRWALDLLLQRLDRATGPVTAHLDLGTTDRAAETARHVGLGATAGVVEQFWTVMADPTGAAYCITDRDPATGRLG